MPDVVNQYTGDSWAYSKVVRDHFFHPRNLLLEDPDEAVYDAEGMIGSPACGDVMRIWLKIDPQTERITDCKWRTFGCASAIAATSMLSVMVTERSAGRRGGRGMKLEQALNLRPQDITSRLGGLPGRKIHCSVLGDKALRAAINNWFKKTGQYERVLPDGSKVIDPETKTTEGDIEEAVLHGARTLADLQAVTKVGIGNPECLPSAEELLRFYTEKHYGKK